MARQVSNVDIITDSFEIWLLETNELLHSLSTEIITANSTYANTGNSTFSRTAQLYGTFGSNNLIVSNWARGGNVNGSFANLMISTNTVLSNTSAANIQIAVSNSTSNSYLNPIGVYLGLGSAKSYVNTSAVVVQSSSSSNTLIAARSIILQSNTTVNSNFSDTLIQVANSTSTANVNAGNFRTGIFQANTTTVAVGSNVVANATTLYVGNSTFNSAFGNGSWTGVANLIITPTSYLTINGAANVVSNANFANTLSVVGNTTLSNTLAVTGNTALSNTLVVTGNATLSNTLTVTGATTLSNTLTVIGLSNTAGNLNTPTANASVAINVGANVNLTTSRFNVGNSTVNTFITSTAIETDGILTVLGAASLANTLGVTGLSSLNGGMNTTTANASVGINVGANVNLTLARFNVGNSTVNTFITSTAIETDGTLTVLGAASLANTLGVTGLSSLNGAMNTTTANASVGINVGANVNLTTSRFNVGNSTVNTFITSTAIETDGTLTVLGASSLSNTLSVTGNTTLSNTLSVSGLTTLSTANVTGTADFRSTITLGNEYVIDVTSNGDIGSNISTPQLIYQFPKATYSSAKFEIQIKNGNTQISELVLAQNGTDAYITVYGTVSSNGGASPLGTFSANTNTANVNLYLAQTVANSAVKVVAHLIK